MSKKEQRVINAFINCVKHGEYSFDYACILIEDAQRYGYLSEDAKDVFYAECGNEPPESDLTAENADMLEALGLLGIGDALEVAGNG